MWNENQVIVLLCYCYLSSRAQTISTTAHPRLILCGVIISCHIRRQLYNITAVELPVHVLGADLGQGHLDVTLPFCASISS